MKIEWIGSHCFNPDLGEMRFGDKRPTTDAIGRKLVEDKLAKELVVKKTEAKIEEKAK